MNAEGIDVTEAESVFSLGELGLSKSKVDALENAGVDSDAEDSDADDESESDDEDVDSEDEYEKMLDAQMEKLYDDYLTRRGDDVKTIKAVKRSKIAKRALAGEALVQDSTLYDGDAQAYQKMINPAEVRVDLRVVCAACYVSSPFVLSVPGRSVPRSVVKHGEDRWIATMSDCAPLVSASAVLCASYTSFIRCIYALRL
jgi:hypothetical protein